MWLINEVRLWTKRSRMRWTGGLRRHRIILRCNSIGRHEARLKSEVVRKAGLKP